jgi:hypothetical protein
VIIMWLGRIVVCRLTDQTTPSDTTSANRGVNGVLGIVDLRTIDLTSDEYQDVVEDDEEEALRQKRISQGWRHFLWRIYYLAA